MELWERIVSFVVVVGLLWAQRYSYRLGVHDGWRARRDRNDPLWNKQRAMLRERGEHAEDADPLPPESRER